MKMSDQKYWAIVPAAGIGARMQADRPKQYLSIHDKPILTHVIDRLTGITEIEKVVVVQNAKDHWWSTLTLSQPKKVLTAVGGEHRVNSVLLGLVCLADYAADDDWILVHDAARPCIRKEEIHRLMLGVGNHRVGGLLGLPVVDTLKQVDQQAMVQKTVSRDGLWYAQTPQLFRYKLLKQAIEKSLADKVLVTDEASAIESIGLQPKMVMGSARNIKITLPEDLVLASAFL